MARLTKLIHHARLPLGLNSITGNELWAFIPPSLHSKLSTMISTKANSTNSIYGVDGSSSVKDVYIDGEWKTVLISSLGAGAIVFLP